LDLILYPKKLKKGEIGRNLIDNTCSYCGNLKVYHRKYSGEYLCSNCFIKSIEKIISKTIARYQMLNPRDKIIVALSGGKDSITLLYNLIKIQEKNHFSEPLIALSIDEGIKNYRKNSIEIAQKFCNTFNIEHKIISFKEKIGKSLDEIVRINKDKSNSKYACNYCAIVRRRLLNDGAKDLGGDVLAIGHNLTDVAETFLMNILYKRFQLIANQFIHKQRPIIEQKHIFLKKITPLMKIPEEEIKLYANFKNFQYYHHHCPYREIDPIVRKRVLEFINNCKNYSPEIEFNLVNGFLELSEILYSLDRKQKISFCKNCGYPSGKNQICSFCEFINTFNC
jgi:uncharacterized protein (TIGR00269 family)